LLDTFFLKGAEEDQRVLSRGLFGLCHAYCAERSGYGAFWASRITANFVETRRFVMTAKASGVLLLRNPRAPEFVNIFQNGSYMFIRQSELGDHEETESGWLVDTKSVFECILTDENRKAFDSEFLARISTPNKAAAPEPLLRLLKELGIDEYLLVPEALASGSAVITVATMQGSHLDGMRLEFRYKYWVPSSVTNGLLS
jgi:hypothetical protein